MRDEDLRPSLALAATLARARRKVILVDGDMRSPSVHLLGGVSHERGLSNFLAGEEDVASLTFAMADLGLTAMSAGPIPPNAAELLAGSRLSLLIERLLQEYDHVVIDSPPVMGLARRAADREPRGRRGLGDRGSGRALCACQDGAPPPCQRQRTHLWRRADQVRRPKGALRYGYGYGYNYGYTYGRDGKKA